MSIWHPMDLLRIMFPVEQRAAAEAARRWTRAFRDVPAMAEDVVRLGRILEHQPVRFDDGVEMPDPIDPTRLAYEAGRRDMALQILALGSLGPWQLTQLMENDQ